MTAKTIDAERACRIGLVNEVYASPEALMSAVHVMAEEIAENSPLAVEATKDVLNTAIEGAIDSGLKYVASVSTNIIPSADLFEALAAFREKRKPRFRGMD